MITPKYNFGDRVRVKCGVMDENNCTVLASFARQNQVVYAVETNKSYPVGGSSLPGTVHCFSESYLFAPVPTLKIGDYEAKATSKNTIQVGCTTVTREQIKQVLALMDNF